MCEFFPHQAILWFPVTLAVCTMIQLNSDTIYMQLVSGHQVTASVPQHCPPWDASHKSWVHLCLWPTGYISGVPTPPSSGLIICSNSPQNSRRHFVYYPQFIIKGTSQEQPNGKRRPRTKWWSGLGSLQTFSRHDGLPAHDVLTNLDLSDPQGWEVFTEFPYIGMTG